MSRRSMKRVVISSAFVAALFAIHPLRVESVAWVAERKDVLSGVFFMLTLIAYVAYARKQSIGHYLMMSILFACGLMSKPMLVTTPFVLLLLDYWPLDRVVGGREHGSQITSPRLIIEKIPLFALSLGSSCATLWAQNSGLATLPWRHRLANAAVSYVSYIGQMFWPHNLVPYYLHPEGRLETWRWI